MSSLPFEKRLSTVEARYRTLRFFTVALTVISVALCVLVGYMWQRAGIGVGPTGLSALTGAGSLELNHLSIKSSTGEERVRLDPAGMTIFGDKEKREQMRLEFSGMRFFNASGESSHFDSQELTFVDAEAGLRCSLDWRYLACADEKTGGLSATFGILAPPKGGLSANQSEFFAKMARTPHLSLNNLKETASLDLSVTPYPSISIGSEASGKTVIGGAAGSSISISDKGGRILWKAP